MDTPEQARTSVCWPLTTFAKWIYVCMWSFLQVHTVCCNARICESRGDLTGISADSHCRGVQSWWILLNRLTHAFFDQWMLIQNEIMVLSVLCSRICVLFVTYGFLIFMVTEPIYQQNIGHRLVDSFQTQARFVFQAGFQSVVRIQARVNATFYLDPT